jgi:TOBE-like domain
LRNRFPPARVQLQAAEADGLIHVDLSPSRLAELGVRTGETVYLFPRKVRVFEADYCI